MELSGPSVLRCRFAMDNGRPPAMEGAMSCEESCPPTSDEAARLGRDNAAEDSGTTSSTVTERCCLGGEAR